MCCMPSLCCNLHMRLPQSSEAIYTYDMHHKLQWSQFINFQFAGSYQSSTIFLLQCDVTWSSGSMHRHMLNSSFRKAKKPHEGLTAKHSWHKVDFLWFRQLFSKLCTCHDTLANLLESIPSDILEQKSQISPWTFTSSYRPTSIKACQYKPCQ